MKEVQRYLMLAAMLPPSSMIAPQRVEYKLASPSKAKRKAHNKKKKARKQRKQSRKRN